MFKCNLAWLNDLSLITWQETNPLDRKNLFFNRSAIWPELNWKEFLWLILPTIHSSHPTEYLTNNTKTQFFGMIAP
jgi:hypothetical protein